jgi:hypothetical protein
LPIERVQEEYPELKSTSSLANIKLPNGMTKDAKLLLKIDGPRDNNDNIEVMTKTEKGWESEKVEMSASGAIEVQCNEKTKK